MKISFSVKYKKQWENNFRGYSFLQLIKSNFEVFRFQGNPCSFPLLIPLKEEFWLNFLLGIKCFFQLFAEFILSAFVEFIFTDIRFNQVGH